MTTQVAEANGDERSLYWYLQVGVYKSILTYNHSQNSDEVS